MITSTANNNEVYLSLNEYDQLGREQIAKQVRQSRTKASKMNDDIREKLENTLLVGMVAGLCIGLFLSSWI